MTAGELIALLERIPSDAEVALESDNGTGVLHDITRVTKDWSGAYVVE